MLLNGCQAASKVEHSDPVSVQFNGAFALELFEDTRNDHARGVQVGSDFCVGGVQSGGPIDLDPVAEVFRHSAVKVEEGQTVYSLGQFLETGIEAFDHQLPEIGVLTHPVVDFFQRDHDHVAVLLCNGPDGALL